MVSDIDIEGTWQ